MHPRAVLLLALCCVSPAEPLPWSALPPALARLVVESGLAPSDYGGWQQRHQESMRQRLAEGAAEHIAYYLLQTGELGPAPRVSPTAEARRYFDSLPPERRKPFLAGAAVDIPFSADVQRRIDAFRNTPPRSERHKLLRDMDRQLGWPPGKILSTAFRFLLRLPEAGAVDELYQNRGLSADPFPASMRAVAAGLSKVRDTSAVLIAGPGAEFGSRFGVDDALPVRSPQPEALLRLLPAKPTVFDCVDVRPEVAASLAGSPCRASTGDLVADRLPPARYTLAVATNVLVYLNDQQLAFALANLSQSLRPGGCLIHNDPRFAARLFAEAAGLPPVHFESVRLGSRNGREQLDRAVVHCKSPAAP